MNQPYTEHFRAGTDLPENSYTPSARQLFLYAASTWNAHRIHYDYVYTTQVEGYENLVIQGPLIADFFTQHILSWLGERGEIASFEYSNRAISYLGETLTASAQVQSVDQTTNHLHLVGHIKNGAGDIVLPATVTVRLNQ